MKNLLKIQLLFFLLSCFLLGCSADEAGLEEVDGTDITYSEFFKSYDRLDQRENITYYKPVPIMELQSSFPNHVVNTIDTNRLPFEVEKEIAYLVTSENEEGDLQRQVQLTYHSKSDPGDFFIMTITEVEQNPLTEVDMTDKLDYAGNELKKYTLTEGLPVFQQIITMNSSLVYRYYDFDEANERLSVVADSANEIYAYHDGFVYHAGYMVDSEETTHEQMLELTRDYILGHDDT
ncbi:hypothetical protein F9U64_10555 [Gracilibacillus oryzae]|uniref:Lipoprotein n=1 Tax=Gracilibacillus oryzae TaxID=1672701 RepID=A0A7C8GT66_9BACI|nr:hypothetical protein [Gracilibacillus oryzae]KAB8135711.1 hypothetical protein F9U64_10555 [Gracilibacillus oryzae]